MIYAWNIRRLGKLEKIVMKHSHVSIKRRKITWKIFLIIMSRFFTFAKKIKFLFTVLQKRSN